MREVALSWLCKSYAITPRNDARSLSSSDSAQITYIANLCPNIYGAAVYKARALYTMVWDDPEAWDDDLACGYVDTIVSGGGGRKVHSSAGLTMTNNEQEYSLYPNPNNGQMVLMQKLKDENAVSAEVINANGQSVYKTPVFFNENISALKLQNICPGLYIIILRDAIGKIYTIKFVINQ